MLSSLADLVHIS